MKNKKKKFSSLKSVLMLLQQLQMKCYNEGPISINIDIMSDSSVDVSAIHFADIKAKSFTFKGPTSLLSCEDTYKELLDWIKINSHKL